MNRPFTVGVGTLLAVCLLCLALHGREPPASPADRSPVPDAAALKEAQNTVTGIYKDDLAKAKKPEEKAALAKKLLQAAMETRNDLPGKFILLEMARNMAVDIAAIETAWSAVEETAGTYQVDAPQLKAETLAKLGRAARTPEEFRSLVDKAKAAVDEALARDHYDVARQLAEAGNAAARLSKDPGLMKETSTRVMEIKEIETALGQAKKAFEKLADSPQDPEANLTAGKFLCFVKGDWAKGLSRLALGSDAKLKALAEKELAKPTEGDKQVEVADGWWEVDEKETPVSQKQIKEHAAQLYAQALPNLTGLAKAKVEKRLEAMALKPAGSRPKELTLDLGNNVTMKLVLIPAGKFVMGSPENEQGRRPNEGPQHEVTISKPFYMGACVVTQEQYQQVTGRNPSCFKGAQNPVDTVSWAAAAEFCTLLSKKLGRTVQLPTEAQWEYACRAGSQARFCFGDAGGKLGDYAWYGGNSDKMTHPAGEKKANAWGLYDMHGNVWEWCQDWYGEDYYGKGKNVDPTGPATGSERVMRGGSWAAGPPGCRSAYRGKITPSDRDNDNGLRVVILVGPGLP